MEPNKERNRKQMRKKLGWTAYGIAGFILIPMGLLFAVVGTIPVLIPSASWDHPDDPVVFMYVFAGVGGLFLILGLIFLLVDVHRRRLLRRAYDIGTCVNAEIIGISTQNSVNMINGHPRVIECAYTDPAGVVHIYRSRYLYTDVTKMLKADTVPVYIDRFNENIGFVDIDAVLPEIRIHV